MILENRQDRKPEINVLSRSAPIDRS